MPQNTPYWNLAQTAAWVVFRNLSVVERFSDPTPTVTAKNATYNPEHLKRLKKTKNCINCDLQGANLNGANLENADLQGANIEGTNLQGADLRNANIKGANLEGSKLDGANLLGANLQGAYLRRAKLDPAIRRAGSPHQPGKQTPLLQRNGGASNVGCGGRICSRPYHN
jgi:hypothetical protein